MRRRPAIGRAALSPYGMWPPGLHHPSELMHRGQPALDREIGEVSCVEHKLNVCDHVECLHAFFRHRREGASNSSGPRASRICTCTPKAGAATSTSCVTSAWLGLAGFERIAGRFAGWGRRP